MQLASLPVVLPLLAAALLSALSEWLPRRLIDALACLVAAATAGICGALAAISFRHGPFVYWFGGWGPTGGNTHLLGISFVIEPAGAGLAGFAALLMLCSFVFAWFYFESVKSLFHALMLVFLAGMCGLCLAGDLFNLFVWFELMSAAGIALCGYKSEEYGPLQGAISFAVTNTLGAYLTLTAIAVIYAHTGALNLAQVGASLAEHHPGDVVTLIAFTFCISGFLVKAAAFPFHFWLADAHAVAPTPVCILFSGVMVELGLFAVARVYWTIFAIPLSAHAGTIRDLFLMIGILTALVGGLECFGQRHLKRLLAFSTISHMGVMLIGFGLLDRNALAGIGLYLLGHGMVKAALFIGAGIVLHHFHDVDEFKLQGRGRRLRGTATVMFVGALGLAGMPTFGNFYGDDKIHKSLEAYHLAWVGAAIMIAGALTSAAVLRASCRIFLGWGERDESEIEGPAIPMEPETKGPHSATPLTMFIPAVMLLALAWFAFAAHGVRQTICQSIEPLLDTHGYQGLVLRGRAWLQPPPSVNSDSFPSPWRALLTAGIALILAAWALYPSRTGKIGCRIATAFKLGLRPLRTIHSGRVGDYVAWFLFGIAAYAGFLLL